jgi:hypothetical protein
MGLLRRTDVFGQIDKAIRIAPLIVVPTKNLHEIAHHHSEIAVKHTRVRIRDNVT